METIVTTSEASFEQDVLAESHNRPVVVDFWAPWCGPCRALTPVLEAEAKAAEGGFLLAKINTDENPNISQQFGIRGIPAVKAFVDGKMVDEFTGALPKPAVQAFLGKLKRGPDAELAKEALRLAGEGELDAADDKAAAALEVAPKNTIAHVVRAQVAASRADVAAAEKHLGQAEGDPDLQPAIAALRARLAFLKEVQAADDEPALRKRVEAGDDADADIVIAAYEVLDGKNDAAFDRLLARVSGGGDHKARAHKLALALIGLTADPEVARGLRKRLSMALY